MQTDDFAAKLSPIQHTLRVLVADDDQDLALLMADALRMCPLFDVRVAYSGPQAEAHLAGGGRRSCFLTLLSLGSTTATV